MKHWIIENKLSQVVGGLVGVWVAGSTQDGIEWSYMFYKNDLIIENKLSLWMSGGWVCGWVAGSARNDHLILTDEGGGSGGGEGLEGR